MYDRWAQAALVPFIMWWLLEYPFGAALYHLLAPWYWIPGLLVVSRRRMGDGIILT